MYSAVKGVEIRWTLTLWPAELKKIVRPTNLKTKGPSSIDLENIVHFNLWHT